MPDAPPVQPGDLLTVAETLRLLPVGRTMLYALLTEGTVPSIRVATLGSRRGRVLVLRRGIDAFVASLQAPPVARPVARWGARIDVDALRARVLRVAAPAARVAS